MPLANRRTRTDVNLTSRPVLLLPSRECLLGARVATPSATLALLPSIRGKLRSGPLFVPVRLAFSESELGACEKLPVLLASWPDGTPFVFCTSASARPSSRRSRRPGAAAKGGAFLAFCFPARARVPLSRPPPFVLLSRPHDLFRGRSEAARCSERRLENYSPTSRPCARRKSPSDALVSRARVFWG